MHVVKCFLSILFVFAFFPTGVALAELPVADCQVIGRESEDR